MRTKEEMLTIGVEHRFQKGYKKTPEMAKKQGESKRVNTAIKHLIYEQLKEDLLKGDNVKQKAYYQEFLKNFLSTALKKPDSKAASTVAGMIFTPDILSALDASHEREMANDINFALYKLNEDFFQEQRDVLAEINHSKKILVCCSRRAGKTEMCSGAIVKSALKNKGSRIIYINLTFNSAIHQIWENVIRESEAAGLQIVKSSKNDGSIEWVNGSSLRIKGNSNNAEADTLRGESKVSLVIIDEAFHQRNMEYAINEVIMPFLADLGDKATILCVGTPPRIPHTYMEKLWNDDKSWRHYHWTAENNPYVPDFDKFIEEVAKAKGLTADAPFIQREYFGKIGVYDTEAMIFKNYQSYTEIPSAFTADRIAIGCDWGFSDYNSIITVAYNTQSGEAYVTEEKKFNKAAVSDIIMEVRKSYDNAKNKFGIDNIQILGDTNEKSITYELYANQHLPAYNAYKYDKAAAIAQLSDWLRTGKIKVNANDIYLKDEFERTLYKRDEDDNILPEIDDEVFHPDAIMALLYASRTVAFDMGDKWEINGENTGGESSNKKNGWN